MVEQEYPFNLDAYKTAYDNNPQPFCVVHVLKNHDGSYQDIRFVYANSSFEKMSGFNLADLVGRTYKDFHGRASDEWNNLYGDVAYNGGTKSVLMPGPEIEPGGPMHYVYIQSFQVAPGYAAFNAIDMASVQKDSSNPNSPENRAENLRLILDSIRTGIAVCRYKSGEKSGASDEIEVFAANDYMCEILEIDRESVLHDKEFIAKPLHILEDDVPTYKDFIKSLVSGANTNCDCEYHLVSRRTRTVRYFHVSASSFKQPDKSFIIYFAYTDITKEKEIQKREQELSAINKNVLDAISVKTFRYNIKAHTLEFLNDKNRVLPDPLLELPKGIGEASVSEYKRLFQDMANGKESSSAYIILKSGGNEEPEMFQVNLRLVQRDQNGSPEIAIGTAMDITERWHSMNLYQEENSFYPNARGNGLIWKGHYDLDHLRLIDQQWLGPKEGLPPDFFEAEQNPLTYFSVIDKDHKNEIERIVKVESLLGEFHRGNSTVTAEFPCIPKQYFPSWMKIVVHMYKSLETGHVESFCYAYDTSRNHIESEMLNRIPQLGFRELGSVNLQTLAWNFYSYQTGTEKNGVQQRNYEERAEQFAGRFKDEEQKKEFLEKTSIRNVQKILQEQDGAGQIQFSVLSASKNMHWLNASLCWLDKERQIAFYIMRDITAEKVQSEAQLEALEKANEAKTDFIYRLNHDIRTPIGIIQNMLDFARKDMEKKDYEKVIKDLNGIESGEQFLLGLINDVVEISRIDRGDAKVNYESLRFSNFEKAITNSLKPLCQKKGLTFTVTSRAKIPGTDGMAVLDKNYLNKIMLNLIGNAVKYTMPGGKICVELDGLPHPENPVFAKEITFKISDTGIGMSEDFQKKMFESFTEEMENPFRTPEMDGTGLGLSIVKKSVELLGGTIAVESQLGKGTSFTVTIPCGPLPEDGAKNSLGGKGDDASLVEEIDGPQSLCGRVLVAEDNAINREIISRMVQDMGLSVVTANNGKEALDKFAQSPAGHFMAILMDVMMPTMNGYEATEKIRALQETRPDAKTIPIIGLTASAFKEAEEKGLKAGMSYYMTKPISASKLKEIFLSKK